MLPSASVNTLGFNDLRSVILVELKGAGTLVRTRLAGLVELVLEDHSGPSNRGSTNKPRGVRELAVDHVVGVEARCVRCLNYDVVLRGIFIRCTRNRLRCAVDGNLIETGFSSDVVIFSRARLPVRGLESNLVRTTHRLEVAVLIFSHRSRDDILYLRVPWKSTNIAHHVSGLTVRSGWDNHACINTSSRRNLIRPGLLTVDLGRSFSKSLEFRSGTGSVHSIVSIRW